MRRIARSPHYGPGFHHDLGPPPPPIVYHTQNWSGVAKGVGGTPQGVFSGAAASAQSAVPAASEAFSIAASGTVPVAMNDGGQVEENIGKSEFSSNSKSGSSGSLNAGSYGNRHGITFKSHGISGEGQHNAYTGLELGVDASGGKSEECEGETGQYNAGSSGFGTKAGGSVSTDYGSSSGQYKPESFDRESGQRSINTDFGRGRQNGQYGSSRGFSDSGNRRNVNSGSLTNGYSAGRGDLETESGEFNLQTSNKEGLSGYNDQSGKYNAGSSGFGGRATASSGYQFGRQNGQFSGAGESRRGFEDHGGNYGGRRQFDSHGGYNNHPTYHHDDFHRHGKSYHETHSGQHGGTFGNLGNNGQDFGGNGQARSTAFESSHSSAFGSKRGNYGSGLIGSETARSGNQDHGEQFEKLDAGLGASQRRSQEFLDTQRQSSSGGSGFGASRKGALTAGNAGISSGRVSEVEGSLSADAGTSGQEDLQSTVGTALNLASQGLQTAQRTPCSTCDKSNYALSNAKSHSGSAIALSIGG